VHLKQIVRIYLICFYEFNRHDNAYDVGRILINNTVNISIFNWNIYVIIIRFCYERSETSRDIEILLSIFHVAFGDDGKATLKWMINQMILIE